MIVVDTNILAYFFIKGEATDQMRRLFESDSEWAAPLLWRSEFRNVLATYLRQSRMDLADALGFYSDAERLLIDRERVGDSRTVLTLAQQSRHSAYDCEFIAVAKALAVPLVTNDRRLRKSFPEIAISPEEFLASR